MSHSIPLVAFDFDHTLLDCNTDVEIQKLSPNGELPEQLKQRMRQIAWTPFMQEVFDYLHENEVNPTQIKEFIRSLPFLSDIAKLLKSLEQHSAEIIIISDSNSIFITELLDAANLTKYIKTIFTNPASFDELGKLVIKPFEHQTECKLSGPNMCKGRILDDYIASRSLEVKFSPIIYAGDGTNDFCPMLRLPSKGGIALPRKGYSLVRHMSKQEANGLKITAELIREWETAEDIINIVSNYLHSN